MSQGPAQQQMPPHAHKGHMPGSTEDDEQRQANFKLWLWLLIILCLASLGSLWLAPHFIPGL